MDGIRGFVKGEEEEEGFLGSDAVTLGGMTAIFLGLKRLRNLENELMYLDVMV